MATTYVIELLDGPFEFEWSVGDRIDAQTQPVLWAKLREEHFTFDDLFVRAVPHGYYLVIDLSDSYYGQPYFKMTPK